MVIEKDNKKEDFVEILDRKFYKRGIIRKLFFYMNCMLVVFDGLRLCILDRKKVDWYIEKGIGRLILILFSFN